MKATKYYLSLNGITQDAGTGVALQLKYAHINAQGAISLYTSIKDVDDLFNSFEKMGMAILKVNEYVQQFIVLEDNRHVGYAVVMPNGSVVVETTYHMVFNSLTQAMQELKQYHFEEVR
jgi:hypothetical protein